MLLLATSLEQLELVGAVVGAAVMAGIPAYRANTRTGRSVESVGDRNAADHSTLFDMVGSVVGSVEGLRDRFTEHDAKNQAEFRAIRERLDKIESRLDIVEHPPKTD